MPRGITQEQVNQAADAILRAGENPTVEKVRAGLGTGSPNTITACLIRGVTSSVIDCGI